MLDLNDLAPPVTDPTSVALPIDVDVIVPVCDNEELIAERLAELHAYLTAELQLRWRITVVDCASTDDTLSVATWLSGTLPAVRVLPLDEPGRGWALRIAWTESSSAVVACVDIDLASKLDRLGPLVMAVVSGGSELATGIRPRGRARCASSALVARIGNAVVRVLSPTHFRDAQCPVKAVRTDLARRLVPEVEADGRWFDSEFLLLADRNGVSIREVALDAARSIDRGATPRTAGGLGELLRVAWRVVTRSRVDLAREPSADR